MTDLQIAQKREPHCAPGASSTPGRWRASLAGVAAMAAVGILAGCAGTPSRGDGASSAREEPGLSVYGVVDVGVTRERGR